MEAWNEKNAKKTQQIPSTKKHIQCPFYCTHFGNNILCSHFLLLSLFLVKCFGPTPFLNYSLEMQIILHFRPFHPHIFYNISLMVINLLSPSPPFYFLPSDSLIFY
jgi:hypothetical protein